MGQLKIDVRDKFKGDTHKVSLDPCRRLSFTFGMGQTLISCPGYRPTLYSFLLTMIVPSFFTRLVSCKEKTQSKSVWSSNPVKLPFPSRIAFSQCFDEPSPVS